MAIETSPSESYYKKRQKEILVDSYPSETFVLLRAMHLSGNTPVDSNYQNQLDILYSLIKTDAEYRKKVINDISKIISNYSVVKLDHEHTANGIVAQIVNALLITGERLPITSSEIADIIYPDKTLDRLKKQQNVGGHLGYVRKLLKSTDLKLFKEKKVKGITPGYFIAKRVIRTPEIDQNTEVSGFDDESVRLLASRIKRRELLLEEDKIIYDDEPIHTIPRNFTRPVYKQNIEESHTVSVYVRQKVESDQKPSEEKIPQQPEPQKSESKNDSPKKEKVIEKAWNSGRLINTSYRVLTGREKLWNKDELPETINLSSAWHIQLNKLRNKSREGSPQAIISGFVVKDGKATLYIPLVQLEINPENLSVDYSNKKSDQFGNLVCGDIISHTPSVRFRAFGRDWIPADYSQTPNNISTRHFYRFLSDRTYPLYTGKVDQTYNWMVFRTVDTKVLPPFNVDDYFKFNRAINAYNNLNQFRSEGLTSISYLNELIANTYNLVIYKGYPDSEFVRVFPK